MTNQPWHSLCDVLALATGFPFDFEPTGGGCYCVVGTLPNDARIYIGTTDGPMSDDDTPETIVGYLEEHDDAAWSVSWYRGDDREQITTEAEDIAAMIGGATDIAKYYARPRSTSAESTYTVTDQPTETNQ